MRAMQVYAKENPSQSLRDGSFTLHQTAVALGGFDAIHAGHQTIIRNVVDKAKAEGLNSAVYLFRNQPRGVVSGGAAPAVCSLEKRLEILEELGVDVVIAEWFTPDYKEVLPETFVKAYLKDWLDARYVAAGFNYRFGKQGAGDMDALKLLCQPLGIEVYGAEPVTVDGETVSSTRIRELLQDGDVVQAARCLKRQFSLCGTVISGNQIGRTMGFPTANIPCPKELILPKHGVYLARCKVDGVWYPAICNVGTRPTVTDGEALIESHLMDFDGDLYGKEIEVAFWEYLRPITKFADLNALQQQLERDKEQAKKYFPI